MTIPSRSATASLPALAGLPLLSTHRGRSFVAVALGICPPIVRHHIVTARRSARDFFGGSLLICAWIAQNSSALGRAQAVGRSGAVRRIRLCPIRRSSGPRIDVA